MGKRERENANMLPGHGKGRGKRHAKVDDERSHIFPPDFKEKKTLFSSDLNSLPKPIPAQA